MASTVNPIINCKEYNLKYRCMCYGITLYGKPIILCMFNFENKMIFIKYLINKIDISVVYWKYKINSMLDRRPPHTIQHSHIHKIILLQENEKYSLL